MEIFLIESNSRMIEGQRELVDKAKVGKRKYHRSRVELGFSRVFFGGKCFK